jgi:glycosyltransferase involved in cell wall biosynthesis
MPNEPAYLASLEASAAAIPSVRILPPVPFAELMDTVAAYDVALAFQRPTTFNIRYAVPNKFFEAVQARTAVVVGPAPELEAVVERHGFGVVTEDFTAEALAAALRSLTPERVAGLKQAAHAAAWELSAENCAQPWVDAVDAMAAAAR